MSQSRFEFPLVLICAFIFSASVSAMEGPSIDGRVLNSATNEGVPQADIAIACLADGQRTPCQNVTGKTDADGTFHLSVRNPGRYRIKASANGLVTTRLSQMEVSIGFDSALGNAQLILAPESTITGRVLDESGQPKPGVNVEAWRVSASVVPAQIASVAKATTNDAGAFSLHGLSAGTYYVATSLSHDDKIYAPSATGLDQAVPIHLDIGQNFSGVEIHLRPVSYFKLQGRAQMDTMGASSDAPKLRLSARDSSGVLLRARDIPLAADGTFQTEVLPGTYTFLLTGTLTAAQKSAAHLLAKQDIEVNGKDLLGLALLIPPPITVNGRVVLDNNGEQTNVAKGRVTIRPVEPSAPGISQAADIRPDGTFVFTNCDPSNYVVRVSPPSGTYVKSIVFNQQEITAQMLDLSRGSGGDLAVTLRPGPASLSGTVSDSGAAGTLFDIALIPGNWAPNGIAPVRHLATRNGRFSVNDLVPGHYTLVATTGTENILWENASFVHNMESQGVGLDLAENDKKSVSVPFVPFAAIDQLRSRLGLD